MKQEIIKIRINELEEFINSEVYESFEFVPISPSRAKSYLQNPNARHNDLALIMAFYGNRLVAFRTFFAGIIASDKTRFGWCSGNWVHPDYRRKGWSKKLLEEALHDWNGKFMFTNYAPESEKLYLKTGWFFPVYEFKGIRAYLSPKTCKLITAANKNIITKTVFSILDSSIALISKTRMFFFRYNPDNSVRFELNSRPDEECYQFLQKKNLNLFFNRKKDELNWIFNFPWISAENKSIKNKYPFSSYSEDFYYQTGKIWRNNEFHGFFIFSVREGHLKTLYFCAGKNEMKYFALFIKNYVTKNNIEMATIYNQEIAKLLFKRKFPFLYVKKYGQKIYSSFKINNSNGMVFQDGDGDVFFT